MKPQVGRNARVRWLTSLAAFSALSICAAVAPAAAGASPVVHGGGSGPLGDERVGVTVNARGGGTETTGRFTITHHTPDGLFAHLAGNVDCLTVAGGTATITGTITGGFDSLGIDPVGERVSLVIHDGEPDSVEMDVSFVSGNPIPACIAESIATIHIEHGNFRIWS